MGAAAGAAARDATAEDAPAEVFARPRPRLRGLDATTRLDHFALVTFAVDPDLLRAVLPAGLEPETRRLDNGVICGRHLPRLIASEALPFILRGWIRSCLDVA